MVGLRVDWSIELWCICICYTMSNTPEYKTLIQCTQQLRRAVQSEITTLSGQLLAAGLITFDAETELRKASKSETERAARLVNTVTSRVQLNPRSYHSLIDILSRESRFNDILQTLNETYASLSGTWNVKNCWFIIVVFKVEGYWQWASAYKESQVSVMYA